MATCDYCSSTILFGGVRDQGYRFCNARCQKKGQALKVNRPSLDAIAAAANTIHQGTCPRCSGSGPVDVHTSHRVMSMVFVTSWSSRPHICCRPCGQREQVKDALFSLAFGWWGFPWGLIVTPIQIIRNLAGLCRELDPTQPSPELHRLVQAQLSQTQAQFDLPIDSPTIRSSSTAFTPTPSSSQPQSRSVNGLLRLLQWFMVGVTALLALPQLTQGRFLPLLCLMAALVVILPVAEPLLQSKIPLLKQGILKWLAWFVLLLTAMTLAGSSMISISNVALCTQPQQGACTADVKDLFREGNPQTLYVSATPDNIKNGSKFKLDLKSQSGSGAETTIDQTIAKASVQNNKLLLAMTPKQLPAGAYQLSISSDNQSFETQTKQFKVWDGELQALSMCSEPQQGQCQKPVHALVKNTPTLYLSATSKHLKAGTPLKWNLQYTPEPGKTRSLDGNTTEAIVNNGKVLLAIKPKELPVGTYQLSLASNPTILVSETPPFTVWDSAQEAQVRLGNKLPSGTTRLGLLQLCDRTGKPAPKEDSVSQIESTFCLNDTTQIKSSAQAIGFHLGLDSVLADTRIKVMWKYIGAGDTPLVVSESVKRLKADTSWLNFTLSSPSGFPRGNYELIVALETKNANPVYRKFTVQ